MARSGSASTTPTTPGSAPEPVTHHHVPNAGDWLLERVGHHGIGAALKRLRDQFHIDAHAMIRQQRERYDVAVPGEGLVLQLAHEVQAELPPGGMPADAWSLAGVKLLAPAARDPLGHWRWPWPRHLDPAHCDFIEACRLFGDDTTGDPAHDPHRRTSFFLEGPHGAALAIELRFTPGLDALEQLWAVHLGSAQPWPGTKTAGPLS